MSNVVVIGSQWGDEGKGKIVDWLSDRADVVVRFQGGHNAGHTLVVEGVTYKLSLLPSGVVRGDKMSVIGNGVVLDPFALLKEIKAVKEQGLNISPDVLAIAENTTLILPIHQHLDGLAEASRGAEHIGTTKRGIGPAYEDKVARRAVRVCDLTDKTVLEEKVAAMLAHHNIYLKAAGKNAMTVEEIITPLMEVAPEILSYSRPVWKLLDDARKVEKRILFEGAQGTMLDIDHGTYPYVTSSNTVAGAAAAGSGTAPWNTGFILGITKAYTTRVGSGPFPTEQDNEIGNHLGTKGHEFGTVTGRERRCGWFDAVMVRQAVKTAGIQGIALTKLDVLDGMKELKICTGYKLDDKIIDHLPALQTSQAKVEPIYETIKGWDETTYGAQSWADLPASAIKYIRRIEELIECQVSLLSTSPKREDTIMVRDPFSSQPV